MLRLIIMKVFTFPKRWSEVPAKELTVAKAPGRVSPPGAKVSKPKPAQVAVTESE